jgi:hypothetical protein
MSSSSRSVTCGPMATSSRTCTGSHASVLAETTLKPRRRQGGIAEPHLERNACNAQEQRFLDLLRCCCCPLTSVQGRRPSTAALWHSDEASSTAAPAVAFCRSPNCRISYFSRYFIKLRNVWSFTFFFSTISLRLYLLSSQHMLAHRRPQRPPLTKCRLFPIISAGRCHS